MTTTDPSGSRIDADIAKAVAMSMEGCEEGCSYRNQDHWCVGDHMPHRDASAGLALTRRRGAQMTNRSSEAIQIKHTES